jgi:hypothetical protein
LAFEHRPVIGVDVANVRVEPKGGVGNLDRLGSAVDLER